MDPVWIGLGAVLVIIGFADVVFTVLYYDEAGLLSTRVYRWIWRFVRGISRVLPSRGRALALSFGIPAMVLGTLLVWLLMIIFGFGLMYWVGMKAGAFDLREGLATPDFWHAIYLSGVSTSTLGYGDVTPISTGYQMLSFTQALLGFAILTLAISYIVNIYAIIRRVSMIGADLFHHAFDQWGVRGILASHFVDGKPRDLSDRLSTLHQSLVEHYEGLRHYPIVYYFYSSRIYPSLPYILRVVGELTAALRWGLPTGHPATKEPWLRALHASFLSIGSDLETRFVTVRHLHPHVAALDPQAFADAVTRGSADPWVERFMLVDRWMRDLAMIDDDIDPAEAYGRYVEWLPFTARADALVSATADDLGYENPLLLET